MPTIRQPAALAIARAAAIAVPLGPAVRQARVRRMPEPDRPDDPLWAEHGWGLTAAQSAGIVGTVLGASVLSWLAG